MATIGSAKATLVNKIDSLTSTATAKDTIFLAKALKENSSLNNFVWQGAWAATTAYATDDVVSNGGNTYMCIVAHTSGASFSVGSDWSIMASAGSNSQLSMTWDNATADADNGAGKIAWNHATIASATILYIDDVDDAAASIQPYVDTWDVITNATAKGIVTITKEAAPGTFATFKVTGAVVDASGYSKVPVTHVVSAGSFTDGDGVNVHFNYSGLDGADGTDIGTTITTQGDILYRDGSGLQRLAAGTSGQFLKTLGSGANLAWAEAGGISDLSPYFSVHISYVNRMTGLGEYTNTKLTLAEGEIDSDSAYDATTNYRFTVPSGKAGKYYFSGGVHAWASAVGIRSLKLLFYKNGAGVNLLDFGGTPGYQDTEHRQQANSITTILDLSVGDYVELWGALNAPSSSQRDFAGYFNGFKIG